MKRLLWYAQLGLRSIALPGWAGLAIGFAAVGFWLFVTVPLRDDTDHLAAQAALLEQHAAARRSAAPAEATPAQQLASFARRFPDEKGMTTSLARLHKVARRHGLAFEKADYRLVSEAGEPLARYAIVLPVKCDYRTLRTFIREAMRELPGLALEEVNVRRGEVKAAALETQLRFVMFVNKAM